MNFGEGPFWTYVLENQRGRFYIGSTDNLEERVKQHNDSKKNPAKYTHKNGPWCLIWAESHPTRSSAMKREKQIKRMKSSMWIRENLLKQ